jgi:hypothetical protein
MARRSPAISISHLAASPELAVLAALLAVLDIVVSALLAVHPELVDHERPYWIKTPDAVRLAACVLRNANGLRRAINRYRLAVMPSPEPTDPVRGEHHVPF